MNTAVINVKVDPNLKREAQGLAQEFGLSLSGIIVGFLKQMVRTREIRFRAKEEPSEWMRHALAESKKDIEEGHISPKFTNTKDAIAWLDNPKRKYTQKT